MVRHRRLHSVAGVAAFVSLTKLMALVLVLGGTSARPAPAEVSGVQHVELVLPSPTGPYAVGRTTLHLVDRSRPDPWVPEATNRELMVSLYYPSRPGRKGPARYATEAEAKLLLAAYGLQDVVPAATFSGTRTHSLPDARTVLGRYPLVLLSPGIDAPRYILTALAEDLASRGYVVAAIDHATG